MQVKCPTCGKEFKTNISRIKEGRKCCSFACGIAHRLRPAQERFWEKVDKKSPDECWPWKGKIGKNGYAGFHLSTRRATTAHRCAYILTLGDIPDYILVCHTCDNPSCVNPSHLWLGNQSQNILDAVHKGRHRATRGEKHPWAKVTEKIVREIRQKYANGGITQQQLANCYNISIGGICMIITKRRWAHVI